MTAWVEREGTVAVGDVCQLNIPDQPVWTYLSVGGSDSRLTWTWAWKQRVNIGKGEKVEGLGLGGHRMAFNDRLTPPRVSIVTNGCVLVFRGPPKKPRGGSVRFPSKPPKKGR